VGGSNGIATDIGHAGWKKHTKLGIISPIGRGLYSIQIQQLLQAMKRYHKSREIDLTVISSEDLRADSHVVRQRVLRILDLQPHIAWIRMESYTRRRIDHKP
jgi:hypothetical protein